jgi:RHS repeat-associated protein
VSLPGPGLINTVAGNGTAGYSGDNGAATSAELYSPTGIALDSSGNVYIADNFNSRIRKINASTGIITTVAGNGIAGYTGDGGSATNAKLNYPTGVAVDSSGNIYIVDGSNFVVRKVTASTGIITTVAGNGSVGYSGDGGTAKNAAMEPLCVGVDSIGNFYIGDFYNVIRKVTVSTGIITTVAGNGTAGYNGDGGSATKAELRYPSGIALDNSGNIYIADDGNNRIRKVTVSTGVITTVVGNGTGGYSGDGGAATSAELAAPGRVALDSSGNIYIADSSNERIREVVVSTGIISTIAGNGSMGYAGDGGSATSAKLNAPNGVTIGTSGVVYIADNGNNRIRAVNTAYAQVPASPTFSPAAGRYLNAQNVTISDSTSGATIYYTTNGTTPTSSSTQYTSPINVSSSESINAIAVANSLNSTVATGTYTIGSSPVFSPVAGTYTSTQIVSITSPDWGATIYYTTDGTTPTTSSKQYTSSISVSSTETLKAIAVLGVASSTVSTATYTINSLSSAYPTATITVNGGEQSGDSNTITVSFNGFVETVTYGPYSTPAAIASAFGAKFSNDYLRAGLCAHASGAVITFKLKGAAPFGTLDVEGSTVSFLLQGSGFATQAAKTVDTGTVTLTVGGVVAAQTSYGDGATPSSIAEGLAAGTTSNSLVNISAVDDTLNLLAKQAGAGTDYSYTLQTTSWDSTDFTQPSFVSGGVSGSLGGGASASSSQGQQTLYSYSIPSYSSGSQPTGYDAVGNIVGYTDSIMGTWSMASGYDPLNRLTAASVSAGTYAGLQVSWGYDNFGNRTSESYTGSTSVSLPTSSTVAYNASNQIQSTSLGSVQYDSAGGVTQDNQNQYLYDGDGRVCAVKNLMFGTMNGYIYGADGTRVSTGTITTWGSCDPTANGYQATKDSILGPTGGQLTETGLDSNGNVAWAHTNVWAGGQLIATYDPNGLHFYLNDWNGSRRVQTDYEGVVEQTCTNLPYGDGESCSAVPTEELYAGLEQDSESGLDHAMHRQYASAFGRWTTPDPYGGSYDWTNPQSLNRYAYVNGMPMGATDPSGLEIIYDTGYTLYVDAWGTYLPEASYLNAIPFVGLAVDLGLAIDELGDLVGWWGVQPQFKGNVKASQSAKKTPNPKCSTAIMQPKYTAIFAQMGKQLGVNPLFIMSTALQESGWNLVHVFGTNSASNGQPLNNLFGMTKAGGNNIHYSSVEASAQAWEDDWGPSLANHPQTIQAYTNDLLSNPTHMYNSNPAYPGNMAARYKQLQDATQACGTTF